MFGLVYKLWEQLLLYVNYIEVLQLGFVVLMMVVNVGQSIGIVYLKQDEVGVKIDYGMIGGLLVLFEIKKLNVIFDIVGNYGFDGEQCNCGVEMNVFGELMLGLCFNVSIVWLDVKQIKIVEGVIDGKDVIGVVNFYVVFGVEYDIKLVEGLIVIVCVNYSGLQYVDVVNIKKLDSYIILDLGLCYCMCLNVDQNEMIWCVGVINVINEKYWFGIDDIGIYLFEGDLCIVCVLMSYDF